MCLAVIAFRQHSTYPLLLAANRDEYYARPTQPLHWWAEQKTILAGKDLCSGGTWLGLKRDGRIALLTNYRESPAADGRRSRGELALDFLAGEQNPGDYLERVSLQAWDYRGFNLLVGDREQLWYFSNRENRVRRLTPGVYALSNRLLDDPWPKVKKARRAMRACLADNEPTPAVLLDFLADRQTAADSLLPDTGVGVEKERAYSANFVVMPDYGTRNSTIIFSTLQGASLYSYEYTWGGKKLGMETEIAFDYR